MSSTSDEGETNDLDHLIHEHEVEEHNIEREIDENERQSGSDDGEKEEESKKIVKPKRIIQNPRPKLNAETLKGSKGLSAMPELFKKQQFRGRGYEDEDLRILLKTYEYWCHRMFPKFTFGECIEHIEKLGNKKPIITLIKKIRMGLIDDEVAPRIDSDEEIVENDSTEIPEQSYNAPINEPILTEEQREMIRLNRERAIQIRKEKLLRIQSEAMKLVDVSSHLESNRMETNDESNFITNQQSNQTSQQFNCTNDMNQQIEDDIKEKQSNEIIIENVHENQQIVDIETE